MSSANLKQAEQLKLIGEQLRQTREQKGIALDQVALKTFIPQRLLQAIEDGELARLPEPIFIQGFIRRYADFVGLDGVELSQQFPVDTSPVTPLSESKSAPSAPAIPLDTTPSRTASRPRGKTSNQFWPWALAGSAALLILGTAIATLQRPRSTTSLNTTTPLAPSTTTPQISPSPLATVSPQPTSTPLATTSPQPTVSPTLPANGPLQVSLNTTDRAWVEVVADGNRVFSDTLAKGDKKTWNAQKSLVITSGNAGAVQLSYNNSPAKPMGKLGEVQEARFTATTP